MEETKKQLIELYLRNNPKDPKITLKICSKCKGGVTLNEEELPNEDPLYKHLSLLKVLFDSGLITQEEYVNKKTELLQNIK